MGSQITALKAELIKCRHTKIFMISFIAFSLVPVMSGIFMYAMKDPDTLSKGSSLIAKADAMIISSNWDGLFKILTQGM